VRTSLGRTGLAVSPIGLGLAALGRPGYITIGHAEDLAGHTDERSLEAATHAVLDAAYTGGVRYFDAARSYGKAEAFLASWLAHRGLGPDDVTVGSKWGYTYTADWRVNAPVPEVKDLSIATLRRQYPESRQLLGANLRLYEIHSATLDAGVLEDLEVLDELASSGRLDSRSASRSQALVNPEPSSAHSKATHSTLSKRRGTCSNPPRVPCSPPCTRPASA
jgi:aryl-alcohol dehydrogenase-like predicted oxidoreductase